VSNELLTNYPSSGTSPAAHETALKQDLRRLWPALARPNHNFHDQTPLSDGRLRPELLEPVPRIMIAGHHPHCHDSLSLCGFSTEQLRLFFFLFSRFLKNLIDFRAVLK
jgi:hypothetical protein